MLDLYLEPITAPSALLKVAKYMYLDATPYVKKLNILLSSALSRDSEREAAQKVEVHDIWFVQSVEVLPKVLQKN